MAYSNGYLPASVLGKITICANGEQGYLRADAARAFMAMNAESERRYGVTLRATSARTAYRPYRDQLYFWQLYQSGRGALAAYPGTSNHGLGLAIDLASMQMRNIVDAIGAKYGFAKRWSDAPSEWWHIKWREGTYSAVVAASKPPTVMERLKAHPLRLRAKALDVVKVQVYLKRGGYYHGSIAKRVGTMGPALVKAVKAFQHHVGLPMDGVVGPKTFAALRRRYGWQVWKGVLARRKKKRGKR